MQITRPGTYDALNRTMFTPLPLSGAVVGMVFGSQMDGSRVDGMRGWGVPAEATSR